MDIAAGTRHDMLLPVNRFLHLLLLVPTMLMPITSLLLTNVEGCDSLSRFACWSSLLGAGWAMGIATQSSEIFWYPTSVPSPPPLCFPTQGRRSPTTPWGVVAKCQSPNPPGNRTTTVNAHLQAHIAHR